MTPVPQPGDVWDRNGQTCRVTISSFRFGDGIREPKLIERDGKAVPHG